MKVDKIITPIVRDTVENGIKKAEKVVENPIKEFSDKAGEVAGRTKVLLDSAKEISDEEFTKIKEELRKKMIARNFSPSVIDSIMWGTTKKSHKLAQILIDDEYAHSKDIVDVLRTLRNAHGWKKADGTPRVVINYTLLEDAAKKRNYPACSELANDYFFWRNKQRITSVDQIEDMTAEVMKRGKYKPRTATLPALTEKEFARQKEEIQTLIKNKKDWSSGEAYQLSCFVNSENIELTRVLASDPNVSLKFIRFATPWTNSENAELMLRAALNKDYEGLCHVAGVARVNENGKFATSTVGKIRINKFDTLDARFAGFRRENTMHNLNYEQETFQVNPEYAGYHRTSTRTVHEMDSNQKSFHDIVKEYCTDDIAEAAKVLLEDSSFDNETVVKILQKMTIDNVMIFKKAIIDKDFATLEKLCGKKFNPKDIDIAREKMKVEFKTTSSTGKITRADFVRYIDDKFIHMDKIDANTLKDSEVRNLAKLLGTTEEQIRNMDKREYRRLCIKTHPDTNQNDPLANQVFRILNRIFQG